jgi:uncharacterized protein (UPF0332 family)
MNETALKFLEKAENAQRASVVSLSYNDLESAASIAYHGLFYTAQALLNAKQVPYRHSHSAVINIYGIEFAKSKLLDPKFHRYLIEARKREIIADDRLDKKVNEEQVREMLAWGKEFIKAAENYLKQAF